MRFIATVKPSDDALHRVDTMLGAGIWGIRVNFARRLLHANSNLVRDLKRNEAVGVVLADIPGRKARLSPIPEVRRSIQPGRRCTFELGDSGAPESNHLGLTSDWFMDVLEEGDILTVADVAFRIDGIVGRLAHAEALTAGEIYDRCQVHVAADRYVPSLELTPEDVQTIQGGASQSDMVGVSFADHPRLIQAARSKAHAAGYQPSMVAKVESPAGVQRLEELAGEADALMLGRGDLSSFYSDDEIDEIGFRVAEVAKSRQKTVLFATDYLASIAVGDRRQPTIAEHRRIERAAEIGVDYLVLNETATSNHWARVAEVAGSLLEPPSRPKG